MIDPEHLSFDSQTNTLFALQNFFSKYASSPDPSLKTIVHNLRILNVLLTGNSITLDNHMGDINLDPNEALPPYTGTRLYLRVFNYGLGAVSIFESWATKSFLFGMKNLFKPISVLNKVRANHMQEFNKVCLKEKHQAHKKTDKPPLKKQRVP